MNSANTEKDKALKEKEQACRKLKEALNNNDKAKEAYEANAQRDKAMLELKEKEIIFEQ